MGCFQNGVFRELLRFSGEAGFWDDLNQKFGKELVFHCAVEAAALVLDLYGVAGSVGVAAWIEGVSASCGAAWWNARVS